MKNLDPDQIGTMALRCLEDVRKDRKSGPYVTHEDETVLLELESEGLAHHPEAKENCHEAELTDDGVEMLKILGINLKENDHETL